MLIGFSLISQSVLSFLKKSGLMYLFMSLLLFFNWYMPFLPINTLLFGLILIMVLTTLIDNKKIKTDLPASFVILFLNYLLLIIVTLGFPRLTQVIDFVFILVFFQYLLSFIAKLYYGVTK